MNWNNQMLQITPLANPSETLWFGGPCPSEILPVIGVSNIYPGSIRIYDVYRKKMILLIQIAPHFASDQVGILAYEAKRTIFDSPLKIQDCACWVIGDPKVAENLQIIFQVDIRTDI